MADKGYTFWGPCKGVRCDHPRFGRSVLTDMDADPEAVIVALAIRGQATCELRIPRDRYDGTLLLDLIEKHGGAVH